MKTREKGYKDYGFDQGEEKRLKSYCCRTDFGEHKFLIDSAIASNPVIAADLYFSITGGVSYDDLTKIKYVPISKPDFYGYQRRCLAIFRNFLLMSGKWR